MKASNSLWKEKLSGKLPEDLAQEVDAYETDLSLKKQGKLDERLIAETRLRRGVYGQRYDNGQRHEGSKVREFEYPSGRLTKGPHTMWDAPGMQRIKIPTGGLNATQIETLAELAEEYSDSIAHITTRQDVQLHYVHIEDTPTIMRRLAAAKITTREACGNSVRNVTACPFAGICQEEVFDVTPYARALSKFLLGHPDCQSFGRKFKPAFSGCAESACGLANLNDLGLVGVKRVEDGKEVRGFAVYVGGGLGTVPYQAKLFDAFLPVEELGPIAQSIARVFARLGEKKNRNRARMKFLIHDLGIEKFKELIWEERKILPPDTKWADCLRAAEEQVEQPLHAPGETPASTSEGFLRWHGTNVRPQRQDGYSTVTVTLPLGDITSDQLRSLADITRRYTRETLRTTMDQNLVIRWVSNADLVAIYDNLNTVGLGQPGAGTIVDIVACPGSDTCKLGISSSRGLAGELRNRLIEKGVALDIAVQNLHIKISGCFNSCGQHHVADIGFYGVSRKMAGFAVPHFQVVLGGEWENNAGSYGLPVLAVPSKNIPDVVVRLSDRYVADRKSGESFKEFVKRIGKVEIKSLLSDLTQLPADKNDQSFFSDWGDPREYTLNDLGVGECAGEVVSAFDFALAAAEREVFSAQVELDKGNSQQSAQTAYMAMIHAAKALVKLEVPDISDDPNRIVREFTTRFYDTQKFYDNFAGGKFAQYLFAAHTSVGKPVTADSARYLIDEAQLFIDASHACYARLGTLAVA